MLVFLRLTHRRNRKWVQRPNPPSTCRRFRLVAYQRPFNTLPRECAHPERRCAKFLFRKLQRSGMAIADETWLDGALFVQDDWHQAECDHQFGSVMKLKTIRRSHDFAPRVGLAWESARTGRISLRKSFFARLRIFYDRFGADLVVQHNFRMLIQHNTLFRSDIFRSCTGCAPSQFPSSGTSSADGYQTNPICALLTHADRSDDRAPAHESRQSLCHVSDSRGNHQFSPTSSMPINPPGATLLRRPAILYNFNPKASSSRIS